MQSSYNQKTIEPIAFIFVTIYIFLDKWNTAMGDNIREYIYVLLNLLKSHENIWLLPKQIQSVSYM